MIGAYATTIAITAAMRWTCPQSHFRELPSGLDGGGNVATNAISADGMPVPRLGSRTSSSPPGVQGTIECNAIYIYSCPAIDKLASHANW